MAILAIFPIAAAIAVAFKKKIEETVFPAIGLIIVTLLFLGMFGRLGGGFYLVPIYVIGSFILIYRKRDNFCEYVLTPGALAFVVYFLFFLIFSYGRVFYSDAALSHYGLVTSNLFKTGSLQDSCLYYNLNTPFPFVTLWAYFCTASIGSFSEWICIFACNIFIVSALIPVFKYIKSVKKEAINWLLPLLLVLLLPILKIPDAYSNFDMAVPQAAAAIYTLIMAGSLLYENREKVDAVFIAYGIFATCTITQYGPLATMPLLIGIIAVALYNRKKRVFLLASVITGCLATLIWSIYKYVNHETGLKGMLFSPVILIVSIIVAAIIVLLWLAYKKGNKVLVVIISLVLFATVIFGLVYVLKHSPYKEYAMKEFVEYTDKLTVDCDEEEYYVIGKRVFRLYDASFLIIAMFVSGLACKKIKNKNREIYKNTFVFNASLISGIFLYLVILSAMYVNIIKKPEQFPVPSIATYTAPVIMLALVIVFAEVIYAWRNKYILPVCTLLILLFVYSDPIGAIFNKPMREEAYPLIAECEEAGLIHLTGQDRVFYIDRDLLEPIPTSFSRAVFPAGADSISGMYYNPEPYKWSTIERTMTPEELATIIKDGGYTYVYLQNVDGFFWETYYSDFDNWGEDIQNNAIYHVEYNDQGQLQIKFIAAKTEAEDED